MNRPKLWYEDAGIFLQNLNATCIYVFKRVLLSVIMIERVLMKLELAMQLAGKTSRSFCRGVLVVNRHMLGYEDAGIFLLNSNAIRINICRSVLLSFIIIGRVLMKLELAMRLAGKK